MKKWYSLLFAMGILMFHSAGFAQKTSNCKPYFIWQGKPNTLEVAFKDESTSPDKIKSWEWTFGDGTRSVEQNPVHAYKKAGKYQVCLLITGDSCLREYCPTITVSIDTTNPPPPPPSTCKANFNFGPKGSNVREMRFEDASSGKITKWEWNFGDGATSTARDPLHTYSKEGTYNVCLTIGGDNCKDKICMNVVVKDSTKTPPPTKCNPDFNFKIVMDNRVEFYASEKDSMAKFHWDFGDNTTSGNRNADHKYSKPGTYKVCLRVSNEFKNDSGKVVRCEEKNCREVVIKGNNPNPEPQGYCSADFTFKSQQANSVSFTSFTGIKDANYSWNFGDGSKSKEKNPTHVYNTTGAHRVCLIVNQIKTAPNGDSCGVTICKRVEMKKDTGISNTCNANFEYFSEKNGTGKTIRFVAKDQQSKGNTYFWSFGDNTSSDKPEVTHTFSDTATYKVCLSIYKSGKDSCFDEKCVEIKLPFEGRGESISGVHPTENASESVVIYPNPNDNEILTLKIAGGTSALKSLAIYNLQGTKVATFAVGATQQGEYQFSLQDKKLPVGMYFVDIVSESGRYRQKLLLK